MGISGFLVFINIAIFVGAFLILTKAFHLRHLASIRWLMLLLFSFCVISFVTLNVYSQNSFDTKVLFSRMRFLGLAFLAPSWLLFLSANYGRWLWLQKRAVTTFLFLPGFFTVLFTLVPVLRPYILTDFVPIQVHDLSVLEFKVGPWFRVHFIWSWFMVLLALALSLVLYREGDRIKRRQILLMSCGTIIAVAIDFYCVTIDSSMRWAMLSGGTFLFNELAIAYAAFRHQLLDPSALAMEKVYLEFPDPVLVIDDTNILRSFNNASKGLFHLSSESLGQEITKVVPQVRLESGEVHHFSELGEERFFDLTVERLGEGETLSGRILYYREVTGRKEVEIRLGQLLEAKARLMALIAHDLSGNVQGQARLSEQLQRNAPSGMQEMADMLADSISSSKELMSNLLSWAKTQENGFNPIIKPFEMNALLEDVLEEVQNAARIKNIDISIVRRISPLIVNGDSEMIASVIRNILTNSIRASKESQNIEVTVSMAEKTVKVEIKDYGSGLTQEKIRRILEEPDRFSSFAGAQGYGIGLSLARSFVELHGGRLEIHSTLGIETRVGFSLPL